MEGGGGGGIRKLFAVLTLPRLMGEGGKSEDIYSTGIDQFEYGCENHTVSACPFEGCEHLSLDCSLSLGGGVQGHLVQCMLPSPFVLPCPLLLYTTTTTTTPNNNADRYR